MNNLAEHEKDILDVVDENDQIVGAEEREKIHDLGLRHREIHVWLFDKEKNIYFQQSGPDRPSAGLLDATVGGHMEKGEKYLEAAVRETKEETGVLLNPLDLELILKYSGLSKYQTSSRKNNFIRTIYICKNPITKGQVTIQGDSDSSGIKKLSLKFLRNLSEENSKIFHKFIPTHELPHVLEYLSKIS
jgi:isopentenyl-diphosphate Delta-isomerase